MFLNCKLTIENLILIDAGGACVSTRKMKTNPSMSPLRKGEIKRIPLFEKEGTGEI